MTVLHERLRRFDWRSYSFSQSAPSPDNLSSKLQVESTEPESTNLAFAHLSVVPTLELLPAQLRLNNVIDMMEWRQEVLDMLAVNSDPRKMSASDRSKLGFWTSVQNLGAYRAHRSI
jgi:hypothetical protein